jgi:hypothetical protein
VYKFSIPGWFKKAESITQEADFRYNVSWVEKNDNCLLYVPFSLPKELLYSAHRDLLKGHDGVQKCKES